MLSKKKLKSLKVDLLILNNCPAFYKINLYNELAKHCNIFVVFSGHSDQVIEADKSSIDFNYIILNNYQVEKRNKLKDFIKIIRLCLDLKPTKLIYGGYIMLEYILLSFLLSPRRNVLQTESGLESKLTGIRFLAKKIILNRFSIALASGSIHKDMLVKMGFRGSVKITKGVGIIDKSKSMLTRKLNPIPKFLYVGRLIPQKNLHRLINVFNINGFLLYIIGTGKLEKDLKKEALPNIKFLGQIPNNLLDKYYKACDIFILPSLSEPWGLVVEEALYNGCVLALSKNVGAAPELLTEVDAGVLFDPDDLVSITEAVENVVRNLSMYCNNITNFDLNEKDQIQLQQYINL